MSNMELALPPGQDASLGTVGEDTAVRRSGYLKKQGQDLFSSWKTRWFEQDGQKLDYYVNEDKKKHKGCIHLSRATAVGPSLKHVRQGEWVFHISTHERLYTLESSSKQDMEGWCASIDEVIDHTGDTQPVSPLLQSLIDGGLAPAVSLEPTNIAHNRRPSQPVNAPARSNSVTTVGSGSDGPSPGHTPPASMHGPAGVQGDPLGDLDGGTIDFINSVFKLEGMSISDPPEQSSSGHHENPNPSKRAKG